MNLWCTILAFCIVEFGEATYSILLADTISQEIGVASTTCNPGPNVAQRTPVVVPGIGAATVQSIGDPDGSRRRLMRQGFLNGWSPEQILFEQAQIFEHERRQYGIININDDPATYSGQLTGDWKGGVTGMVDSIKYAIQGNVLSGPCVVLAIQDYIESAIASGTSIPDMSMRSLEIGRDLGGDGRCSCEVARPMACGCPPVSPFRKASHVGYVISALPTDADSDECGAAPLGCANGQYYLDIRVPPGDIQYGPADPDPVALLRVLFDLWSVDPLLQEVFQEEFYMNKTKTIESALDFEKLMQ